MSNFAFWINFNKFFDPLNKWVTREFRFYLVFTVEINFKWEEDEHQVNIFFYFNYTFFMPCPKLR